MKLPTKYRYVIELNEDEHVFFDFYRKKIFPKVKTNKGVFLEALLNDCRGYTECPEVNIEVK